MKNKVKQTAAFKPRFIMQNFLISFLSVFLAEHIIEESEEHNIHQIHDRDYHVGKKLRGGGKLCFEIHGNHSVNDDGNHENYAHCQYVGRVFFPSDVRSKSTGIQNRTN